MIRVYKSPNIPASLTSTSSYDGEDVKLQLLEDQHGKCYICERCRDTDFEIEHYKSQNKHPEFIQDWSNLFMGCRYCNGKKSNYYDDILNPRNCNIEEEIEQRIDFSSKKAIFNSHVNDKEHVNTAELLSKVYNGSKSVRSIKEERFFEKAISIINNFLDLVYLYLKSPSTETENAIKEELSIEKELLGFKYWIIHKNPTLNAKFANDMVWNRKNQNGTIRVSK